MAHIILFCAGMRAMPFPCVFLNAFLKYSLYNPLPVQTRTRIKRLTNPNSTRFDFHLLDPPPFPYCLIRLCRSTIVLVKIETNWFNLMVVSFKEDNSNTQSKQLKVKNRVITVMHILQKVPRLLARTSRLSPCVTRSFYIYSPEPLHALLGKQPTWKTADQAVEAIQSGKQNTYTDSCPETMSTQSSYFLLLLKKVADRLHWGFCHG